MRLVVPVGERHRGSRPALRRISGSLAQLTWRGGGAGAGGARGLRVLQGLHKFPSWVRGAAVVLWQETCLHLGGGGGDAPEAPVDVADFYNCGEGSFPGSPPRLALSLVRPEVGLVLLHREEREEGPGVQAGLLRDGGTVCVAGATGETVAVDSPAPGRVREDLPHSGGPLLRAAMSLVKPA